MAPDFVETSFLFKLGFYHSNLPVLQACKHISPNVGFSSEHNTQFLNRSLPR